MALPLVPILGGAGQLVSGILGNIFSSGDREEGLRMATEAYQQLEAIGMPPDQALPLILEKFKQVGNYTPELEDEIKLGISQVSQIKESPDFRDAQLTALRQLQDVSRGGLRPEDRAVFNQLRTEAAREAQGRLGQIQQSFQQRGMGGQGAELAAQLSSAQEGAGRLSAEGDRISAEASRRALEALTRSGQMAGEVRGQEFDIARTKAGAEDEIARMNAANALAIQSRNISAKNLAQQSNLAQRQRTQDINTQISNQELLRQRDAQRQRYLDQLQRQQLVSQAKLGAADLKAGQAQQTAQTAQGIGTGIGKIAGDIYQSQQQDETMNLLKRKYGVR
jgi:hypothetical protein